MVRILVPPGVGDLYWVLTKLPAFLKREGLENPEISVLCPEDLKYNSHLRSIPYIQMHPMLKVGTPAFVPNDPELYEVYLEAYSKPGRTIWPDFMGFDYFMSYNGHINSGRCLEDTDPDLACDWYPEMSVSFVQTEYARKCRELYGDYTVFYWPFYGSFTNHIHCFPVNRIHESIAKFIEATGTTPVFVGSLADIQENDRLQRLIINRIHNAVNLVGKTTLDEFFGVVKGSRLVVGYHSGMTNMAVVFKKKTVLLWGDAYPKVIMESCFPPDTRGTNYIGLWARDVTVNSFTNTMLQMYKA